MTMLNVIMRLSAAQEPIVALAEPTGQPVEERDRAGADPRELAVVAHERRPDRAERPTGPAERGAALAAHEVVDVHTVAHRVVRAQHRRRDTVTPVALRRMDRDRVLVVHHVVAGASQTLR